MKPAKICITWVKLEIAQWVPHELHHSVASPRSLPISEPTIARFSNVQARRRNRGDENIPLRESRCLQHERHSSSHGISRESKLYDPPGATHMADMGSGVFVQRFRTPKNVQEKSTSVFVTIHNQATIPRCATRTIAPQHNPIHCKMYTLCHYVGSASYYREAHIACTSSF